jgi:hypothetical protein
LNVNGSMDKGLFRNQHLILPAIYVIAVFLTTALSASTPGGAYYRILSLCPPVASLGMVVENDGVIVAAFLLLGTPWWYLVGRIGWDGHERRRSFVSPVVGALIALFTCFVSTGMTIDPLKQDIHDGSLRSGAVSQYLLVALLCVGALLSVFLALAAALSPRQEP